MTTQAKTNALHRLRKSKLELADAAADIRGRRVTDSAGQEIGKVDDLMVDERERRVRFLEVSSGGLLGIGENQVPPARRDGDQSRGRGRADQPEPGPRQRGPPVRSEARRGALPG